MNIEGTYTFDAEQKTVWDALQDPKILAQIMPGCEKLEKIGANAYEGVMKIRVGAVQGVFKGEVHLSELNAPSSYTMHVKGNGPQGFVEGTGSIHLTADGAQTTMNYTGGAEAGGRIAGVGQRLIERSAKAIIKQSLDGLNQLIQAQQTAAETGVEPEPTAPPSEIKFAIGVAKNIFEDIDEEERKNIFMIGLAAIGGMMLARGAINHMIDRIAQRVVSIMEEKAK